MGNVTSGLTTQTPTNQTNIKKEEVKTDSESEQNVLIEKVLDVSIELLKKYNQEFLREDFCYDIAFVMEQQLNGMNVKVLRELESKMNSEGKEVSPELKLILQYMPKNDEKFYIEGFEKQLTDMFWNNNIVFDPEILKKEGIESEEGMDLSTMELFKDKNKFKYIDLSKINDLLRDRQFSQKKQNNAMEVNELENQMENQTSNNESEGMTGGANNSTEQFKKELERELGNKNATKGKNGKNTAQVQRVELSESTNFSNNNLKKLKESFKETLKNPSLSAKNKANSIQQIVVENLNRRLSLKNKKLSQEGNSSIHAKKTSPTNNLKTKQQVRALVNIVRNTVNNAMNSRVQSEQQKTKNSSTNNREVLRKEVNSLIQQEINKMTQNINTTNKKPVNEKPKVNQKQGNVQPNQRERQNERTSQTETKTEPQSQPQTQPNENRKNNNRKNNKTRMVNEQGMIRYSVPKDYQKPTEFCVSGVEKCGLSKKDLCKVITENIVVRCNIIAAILSVLPNRKSKSGEYYGGYLYSKFMNLGRCQVCVPKNYMDLKRLSPLQLVKHVAQYADFMDFKTCKDNGGYFLKLSKDQIKSLYDNVPKENQAQIGDKTNFNAFYIDCAENLKTCYFDNLKVLLDILMELKNNAFINNDVLNQIGNKTKQIIDTMYHLAQYYYIFGIVSLLNANINKVDEQEMVLQQSFSKMLKKKTKVSASGE